MVGATNGFRELVNDLDVIDKTLMDIMDYYCEGKAEISKVSSNIELRSQV